VLGVEGAEGRVALLEKSPVPDHGHHLAQTWPQRPSGALVPDRKASLAASVRLQKRKKRSDGVMVG
jgi:hypothetical protein